MTTTDEIKFHVAIYPQTVYCRIDLPSSMDMSQEQQDEFKALVQDQLGTMMKTYFENQ